MEERKGVQIGKHAKKGDEKLRPGGAGGRGWKRQGGKGFQKVDGACSFMKGGEATGGAAGKGQICIRCHQEGGWVDFFKKSGLFRAVGTTEGEESIGWK